MGEHDQAIALTGNHEYNALCFHHEEQEGGHLRKNEIKNILQHYETLFQFKNQQEEYDEYIDWFLSLPLFYEDERIRVIHACRDYSQIEYLRNVLINNRLTEDLLHNSIVKESELFKAIEVSLKGKEIPLPNGISLKDKDGFIRPEIRIKWWIDPRNETFKSISVIPYETLPNISVPNEENGNNLYYRNEEKPVFFGHYWLKGKPILQKPNVCCLDYSMAKKGELVAYRYNGEKELLISNFITAWINSLQALVLYCCISMTYEVYKVVPLFNIKNYQISHLSEIEMILYL